MVKHIVTSINSNGSQDAKETVDGGKGRARPSPGRKGTGKLKKELDFFVVAGAKFREVKISGGQNSLL